MISLRADHHIKSLRPSALQILISFHLHAKIISWLGLGSPDNMIIAKNRARNDDQGYL